MENRIKELRNRDKLTQEQLAEAFGTSKSMVSMLESGERRLNTDWIEKLCKQFNVRPNELFKSDLDYREIVLSEKISRFGPEALKKLDDYADLLLLQHSQRTEEKSSSQGPSDV